MTQPHPPEFVGYTTEYSPLNFDDQAHVPLVIYIQGERKIIGEAVVSDGMIRGVIGDEHLGNEILETIFGRPDRMEFSMSFPGPEEFSMELPEAELMPPPIFTDKFRDKLAEKIQSELRSMNDTAKES